MNIFEDHYSPDKDGYITPDINTSPSCSTNTGLHGRKCNGDDRLNKLDWCCRCQLYEPTGELRWKMT